MNLSAITTLLLLSSTSVILYDLWQRSRVTALVVLAYVTTYASCAISGIFARHSELFPPRAMNVMTGFLFAMVALLLVPSIRKGLLSIPTKRLVMWHWVRLPIGLVFLSLAISGALSPLFGQIAGWGDAFIGIWAIGYVFLPTLNRPLGTSVWNAAAFADMIASVGIATFILASPKEAFLTAQPMEIMNTFPLVMVPGFAVPMLLVSNFLVWQQVRQNVGCCRKIHRGQDPTASQAKTA